LGILGWLFAIPIGSFLVKYLLKGVSSTINNLFVRVRVESLHLDIWEILLSFLVTLLVSFLAAYRPAREATHIAPREAMMMHESAARQTPSGRFLTPLGLLLIALTWPVSKLPGLPGFPVAGYLAVLLLIVGFSMLTPPILHWMGSYLPPILRRIAGEPAFLAGRNVRDASSRTAISVGALVTAMALFVALVIMVHSFRQTVTVWVNQTLAGDFFIRAKMAGFNQYHDSLPGEVVDALKHLEDVELLPYRHLRLQYGKIPYQFEAISFELFLRHGNIILLKGDLERIREELIAGEGVLVSEVFSNRTGLGTGQRYRVQVGEVTLTAPILGVFRDYRTRGGAVYTDLHWFQRLTGDRQWSGVRFFFIDREQDLEAAADRLRSQILRCCGQHPMDMSSGAELRREILNIFDETFAITTVLLLIALLIAALGITTTLSVQVLERTRQLNTLVAVGARSGQIRSMIFWEAILMVSVGEGLGLVCGFFLSRILIYVINFQSFGWTFLYRVDWNSILLSVPLILATALLSALPAVRLALCSSPALVLKEL
jgi:putative ABC transport system permease protein